MKKCVQQFGKRGGGVAHYPETELADSLADAELACCLLCP